MKGNQKGVLKQCEEPSRIRPLVDSSKKELNRGRLEMRETKVFRVAVGAMRMRRFHLVA